MKLYLIRHGESESNAANVWTGWLDAPLTEKGFDDAKRARPFLEGISFDKVYASDLTRACQTAQTVLPGCDPEKTALLREIHLGSLAGTPRSNTPAEIKALIADGYTALGGESRAEFKERLFQFLSMLEQQNHQTVAAFSHAGCLMTILDKLFGFKIPRSTIQCNNCCIAVLEYSTGRWTLHSWINTQ